MHTHVIICRNTSLKRFWLKRLKPWRMMWLGPIYIAIGRY